MLTLTRKCGESIVIGNDIVITVKEIRRNQIRISIEAPKDLLISRMELREGDLTPHPDPTPSRKNPRGPHRPED